MALHDSIKLPLLQLENVNPFHSKGLLMFSGGLKGNSEEESESCVATSNAFLSYVPS